uniref:Non-muscle caldesmon-like n=1 Tax=Lepisosteus oculatus TaxID=7918 RepID=W5M2G3_LEPOC|nr:PREDICTED: non-muscle caldesmon-like isoform X1 [Lepisosteus oculatus]
MSSVILRRNSSKKGLQNLLRLTAQRSIEDEEEIARERRRRAREAFRSQTSSMGGLVSEDGQPAEHSQYDSELKSSGQEGLEEDEGFSDWTQKLERRRQKRLEEQCQGAGERVPSTAPTPESWRETEEREGELQCGDWERKASDGRVLGDAHGSGEGAGRRREREDHERPWKDEERQAADKGKEKDDKVKENKKELKVTYKSKVFLQQEVRHINSNGAAAEEEVTSHLVQTKRMQRSLSQSQEAEEEQEVFLETEQKLEKIRRSHQEKESQEFEQLRQKQLEAEAELEELNRRREQRRRLREEEEQRRGQEEHQRQLRGEEERRRMKEEIEKRRMEAAEKRLKHLSTSSAEGEEPFSPLTPKSPTFKNESEERVTAENTYSITERTESLNRSLKKSNSVKKTQPPVPISKIDDRLELYTHAIESSTKETRAAKQAVVDIPSPSEPISSKKSLFEAEAWSQSSAKGTPSKDTEGLKVGVADLITQWVKGTDDCSTKNSPSKPADFKVGDVLHKKSLWEIKGDSASSVKTASVMKGTPSGKRYKFVVTGHGKYEKVPISDNDHNECTNGKSTGLSQEDL